MPWLPQPAAWGAFTVEAEAADPESMLQLYRRALEIRRRIPGFRAAGLEWLSSPTGTLRFRRGDRLECAVNVSADALVLPDGRETLVSTVGDANTLPRDAAAWYVARTVRGSNRRLGSNPESVLDLHADGVAKGPTVPVHVSGPQRNAARSVWISGLPAPGPAPRSHRELGTFGPIGTLRAIQE